MINFKIFTTLICILYGLNINNLPKILAINELKNQQVNTYEFIYNTIANQITFVENVKIIFDNRNIKYKSTIINKNNKIYYPLIDLTKSLNADIFYDEENNKTIIMCENKKFEIENKNLDSFVYDGKIYVPIRTIVEGLGYTISFDKTINSVIIYSNNIMPLKESKKIPILLYHHILKNDENKTEKKNGAVVSLENFEKQMKYLYENGFYTITIHELYDYLYNKKPLPEKSIMINFDDGYLSNFDRAYPILKKYNLRATIFLITSYLPESQKPFDPEEFYFLGKDRMDFHSDVYEYATHTDAMHKKQDNGKTILCNSSKQDIKIDLDKSFQTVDYNTIIAYPLGQYNNDVIETLKETSIKMGLTVKPGYINKNTPPYELNRFIIFITTSFEEFKKIVNLQK